MTPGLSIVDRSAALSFGLILIVATGVGASLALVAGLIGPFLLSLVAAACLTVAVYAFNAEADQITALGSITLIIGMVTFTATLGFVAQATFAALDHTETLIELLTASSPFVFITAMAFGFMFLGLSVILNINDHMLWSAISEAGYVGGSLLSLAGLLWGSTSIAEHTSAIPRIGEIVSVLSTSNLVFLWFVLLVEIGLTSILLYRLWNTLPAKVIGRSTADEKRIDISLGESDIIDGDIDEQEADPSDGKTGLRQTTSLGSWLLKRSLTGAALIIVAVYPFLVRRGHVPLFVKRGINSFVRTQLLHIILLGLSVCAIVGIVIVKIYQRARFATPKNIVHDKGAVVGSIILAITIVPVASSVMDGAAHALPPGPSQIVTQVAVEVGPATLILGLLGGIILAGTGIWFVSIIPMYLRLVPIKAAGLAIGSGCLLIATFAAALASVPTVMVFGGVAATIFIWDVGENAIFLDQQVDPEAQTSRGELIHISSSFVTALFAIGIAYLASFAPRLLSYSVTPVQLLVALVLSVTATVGFLVLLRR